MSAAGGMIRAAVVHKSQPKAKAKAKDGKEQKPLSSGFGFVECSSEDVAKAALKRMQVGGWMLCLAAACAAVGPHKGPALSMRSYGASAARDGQHFVPGCRAPAHSLLLTG